MNESVYLFAPWMGDPVYHSYGRIRDETDVTKCGLVLYAATTQYHALLRRDQANLFARPCGKCFKDTV